MEQETKKIRRILFCTDFSDNASLAFDGAVELARLSPGSELTLLHVLAEPDAQFWKTYTYSDDQDCDVSAREALNGVIDREYLPRVGTGVVFKREFRVGKAHTRILECARELGADLIVVGRQGCGALKSLFFGSVASKVVQRADCPVLVIPMR